MATLIRQISKPLSRLWQRGIKKPRVGFDDVSLTLVGRGGEGLNSYRRLNLVARGPAGDLRATFADAFNLSSKARIVMASLSLNGQLAKSLPGSQVRGALRILQSEPGGLKSMNPLSRGDRQTVRRYTDEILDTSSRLHSTKEMKARDLVWRQMSRSGE